MKVNTGTIVKNYIKHSKNKLLIFGTEESINNYITKHNPKFDSIDKIYSPEHKAYGRKFQKVLVLKDCPESLRFRAINFQNVEYE